MIKLQVLPEEKQTLQVLEPIVKTNEPVILPKYITENGVYSAKEENATGYDPVRVEVDLQPAFEAGRQAALESLPEGYIKVDPTWTDFSHLCNGRRYSLGINLKYSDTANGTNFSSMFYGWDAFGPHTIPSLDLRKGTNFQSMFQWSARIAEIGEMDISNATNVTGMFGHCYDLERISFVPGCIKLSLNFAQSNLLNDASIQSIIDGLADLTGKTSQALTFHAGVGAKLTEEQKAAITAKNWTLVY